MDVRVERLRFERSGWIVLSIDALDFPSGKTTAVLGPNGAGKTTLLRILCGLERPSEGRALLGSAEVNGPSRAAALAFQSPVFLRGTVRQNIELALELRGAASAERAARTLEAAKDLGITALLDREANRLSRGEVQRANLCRALCLRAPVTLLDEPLAGLDAPARSRLIDDLPRIFGERGSTVILVTHDRDEALRLAEHLVILENGRARAAGPAADVFRNPPDPASARLLGYTVIPLGEGFGAAPPGALSVGDGDPPLEMIASRALETAQGREVLGVIAGVTVRASLPAGEPPPAPGGRAPIRSSRWVMFPASAEMDRN